jgi:hypothetical protein
MDKKDYIVISEEDFWKIYRLLDKIEFDEERADSNIRYILSKIHLLRYYIENNRIKKWILKHIIKIDLEKELKEFNKYLLETIVTYLFMGHKQDLWALRDRLEKILSENNLNKSTNEPKNG